MKTDKTANPPPQEGFLRRLGLLDAITLVVGSVIGSGIFIVSADIARTVNSVGMLFVVWIIATTMTVIAALSYSELAAAMPKAGGQYVFLREAFGKLPAFLFGWTTFLVISTGIVAAVAVAFAKFFGVLFPWVSAKNILVTITQFHLFSHEFFLQISTQQMVAMIVIICLTAINCRGVKEGALIQNIFTFLKVAAIFALVVAGLTIGKNPDVVHANFTKLFESAPSGLGLWTALGAAMVGGLFAMDSWTYVCTAAAEVQNPQKNLPRALIIGTGFVGLLYIIVNIAYLHVIPLAGQAAGADIMARGIQYAAEDRVATAVAQTILGDIGMYLVAVAIMISTFGSVNGNILLGARMYYAMAQDGLFFRSVGTINSKSHVPTRALITGGIWSCLLTLTGSYSQLLDYIIFAALLFYSLTIVGVFVLRKTRPDMERPYRAWGYPILPAIYVIVAMAIAVDLLIYKPTYTWPGLGIVISAIPVYYIWKWIGNRRQTSEGLTS